MNIDVNFNPLVSVGYLSVDVPKDVMGVINNEIEGLLTSKFSNAKPANNNLYGAIENEYDLLNSFNIVDKFSCLVGKHYWNFTPHKQNVNKQHKLRTLWVNFQKKHEFNPLHVHVGSNVVLSFVIWVKIPYNIKNEIMHPSVKNSNGYTERTTSFGFVYSNGGSIHEHTIQVDQSFEGKMIIFPSNLHHQVYPFFTSDEFRISVAGNIILED